MANLGDIIASGGVVQRSMDDRTRQEAEDEYTKQARKVNLEAARANAAMLPSRNAALGAQYALQKLQAEEEGGLVGKRGKVAGQALDIESKKQDQLTKNLPALFDLDDAGLKVKQDQAKVALAQSGLDVETIPDMVRTARAKGAIDDAKVGVMLLGGLGYVTISGNEKAVVDYANRTLQAGLVPGMEKRKVNGARAMQGPKLDAEGNIVTDPKTGKPATEKYLELATEDGEPIVLNWSAVKQAYATIAPSEYEKLGKGERLVKRTAEGDVSEVVGIEDDWDYKDGLLFNKADPSTRIKIKGASSEQLRLLVNDARGELATAFGAKMDPITKMLDIDLIKDKAAYFRALAEAEGRIRTSGEDPMAVVNEIAQREIKRQKVDEAIGSEGGSGYSGPTPWKR